MVYSTRRFVVCRSVCHFVLVFFSPFSIAITSLGEERANLNAIHTFVQFVLVWICPFHLPMSFSDYWQTNNHKLIKRKPYLLQTNYKFVCNR